MENSTAPRTRGAANPSVDAKPITQLEPQRQVATGGRPKKLRPMPMLDGLSDAEKILFNDFIEENLAEYPDISATDYRMLFLIGAEYIKYVRVVEEELRSGKVLSMARQHPGTNMRALQDQLSITRKARMHGKPQDGGEEAEKLREILYQVSKS